jgi:hypothetical protein
MKINRKRFIAAFLIPDSIPAVAYFCGFSLREERKIGRKREAAEFGICKGRGNSPGNFIGQPIPLGGCRHHFNPFPNPYLFSQECGLFFLPSLLFRSPFPLPNSVSLLL